VLPARFCAGTTRLPSDAGLVDRSIDCAGCLQHFLRPLHHSAPAKTAACVDDMELDDRKGPQLCLRAVPLGACDQHVPRSVDRHRRCHGGCFGVGARVLRDRGSSCRGDELGPLFSLVLTSLTSWAVLVGRRGRRSPGCAAHHAAVGASAGLSRPSVPCVEVHAKAHDRSNQPRPRVSHVCGRRNSKTALWCVCVCVWVGVCGCVCARSSSRAALRWSVSHSLCVCKPRMETWMVGSAPQRPSSRWPWLVKWWKLR